MPFNMLRGQKLFGRLLFYFLIIAIFPLSLVLYISYFNTADTFQTQSEKSLVQTVQLVTKLTETFIEDYSFALVSTSTNQYLQQVSKLSQQDAYEKFFYLSRFENYLTHEVFTHKSAIQNFFFVNSNGLRFEAGSDIYGDSKGREQRYERLAQESTNKVKITVTYMDRPLYGGKVFYITLFKGMDERKSWPETGLVGMDIESNQLESLWKEVNLGEKSYFSIVDAEGLVIYHPDSALIGKRLDWLDQPLTGKSGFFQKDIHNEKMLIFYGISEVTGWTLIATIPWDEVLKPSTEVRKTTLIVGAAALVLALLLAMQLSSTIVKPIKLLRTKMNETRRGQWYTIPEISRQDEIGSLMQGFNGMVDHLSKMIEHVYEAEIRTKTALLEKKSMELAKQQSDMQALQLQINPHFLYNSLEIMNSIGLIYDSEPITVISESLAAMFRYAVTSPDQVQLIEELDHVKNYLQIQQYRNPSFLIVETQIDPNLLNQAFVKLTLQPLLENSFIHAFPKGINPTSRIKIYSEVTGSDFYLHVEDNGAGIASETEQRLNEQFRNPNPLIQGIMGTGGIGLSNVNFRIQLIYGHQYGLKIQQVHPAQSGTCVTMHLPLQIIEKERFRVGRRISMGDQIK